MIYALSKATRSSCPFISKRLSLKFSGKPFSIATTSQATCQDVIHDAQIFPGTMPNITATTRPPSARPVETRKSQLIRTYTSLLRTTPLILFFQHSNLTAVEWAAVRRELKKSVDSVQQSSASGIPTTTSQDLSNQMQLQVVRTNMLKVALKIVELSKFEHPTKLNDNFPSGKYQSLHDLSETVYKTVRESTIPEDSAYSQLEPVMVGPLAALLLPAVSPPHLAAALSVLAPIPGLFPAPTRKKSPGYYDVTCQNGLSKLLLVGGRIEGKVLEQSVIHWLGSIQGGLTGLRGQLVSLLQGAGLGITTTLQSSLGNVWLALERRKIQLDEGKVP